MMAATDQTTDPVNARLTEETRVHIRNMSPGDLALMKNLAEAAAEKTVQKDDRRWHLDKRVPVALIVTILVQSGAAIWWAAGQSERVNALERADAARAIAAPVAADRLTRVEVKVDNALEGIAEIKRLIRREPQPQ